MARTAEVKRQTGETKIELRLDPRAAILVIAH